MMAHRASLSSRSVSARRRGSLMATLLGGLLGGLLLGAPRARASEEAPAVPHGTLAVMGGAGLGLMAAGSATMLFSGQSRTLFAPALGAATAGLGLFGTALLGEIYGLAAPAEGQGRARSRPSRIEAQLGYLHVVDPVFRYRHLATQRLDLRVASLLVQPRLSTALTDPSHRASLRLGHRFLGPTPGLTPRRVDPKGVTVDAVAAATHRRQGREGFTTATLEVALEGRVGLERVGEALRGSYCRWGLGLGAQNTSYDLAPESDRDVSALLLLQWGFGIELDGEGSTIEVIYDHRHDDYAGGLLLTGLVSGVAGHFGLRARWWFHRSFGLGLEGQIGSAYLAGLGVMVRTEAVP